MSDRPFIHEDFLLETARGRELFHTVARDLPIIDFHNHLSPRQIAEDHRFADMAEAWLTGDHYKWRAMRANGIEERLCTGDAPPRAKFDAWAATMPRLLRNPLFDWTHLELARFFGIDDRLLSPETADGIWEECNARLGHSDLSCRGILTRMRVEIVCTTDDPTDSLEHHHALAADDSFATRVLPTWRPDRALAIEAPGAFNEWVDALAAAADTDVRDLESFLEALRLRHAAFQAAGCRLSDHGLTTIPAEDFTAPDVEAIFDGVRSGHAPSPDEVLTFQSAMLWEFGLMNHEAGWTQQLHIGALRNTRTRLRDALGPDAGGDSMGDHEIARPLTRFLDRLDRAGKLAPTILYNHNPKDLPVMLTAAGSFQEGPRPGKIQVGPPWWFLDQRNGIESQIETLSQVSLLSRFVGMVTDSRSFLSMTRHEYFRRILCNMLGRDMEAGRIPDDMGLVGGTVHDIGHGNAARQFGFEASA